MAHSITLKDVAKEARVSIGTVARVFYNQGNMTDEVRQRVLRVAAQLGYFSALESESRPYPNSRTVREVGFLFCTFITHEGIASNPFFTHILHGAEIEASKLNLKLVRFFARMMRWP